MSLAEPSDAFVLTDTQELRAIADRIDQHAGATRQSGEALRQAAVTTPWQGPAATSFVLAAVALAERFARAADQLETAARALRRHVAYSEVELPAAARAAAAGRVA